MPISKTKFWEGFQNSCVDIIDQQKGFPLSYSYSISVFSSLQQPGILSLPNYDESACWTGADRVCALVSNLLAALSSPPPPPCLGCWKAVIDESTVGEGGWKMLRPCGAPLKGDTQTHTWRHTHLCKNTNNVLQGCQLSEPPLSWLTESPTYTRSPPFTIVLWWSAGRMLPGC